MKKQSRKNNSKLSGFKSFIVNILIISVAVVAGAVFMINQYLGSQKPIENLDKYSVGHVSQMYSADGVLIKTFKSYNYEKFGIKDIPQNLINAIIATEDKNFYNHHGYDLWGILRSTIVNVKAGKTVQGASTITQQLSRMLFLDNERSYTRKIKEIIISARIEKTLSKQEILEMYLNNVYLGSGAYGAAGAAATYFDKPLKDLTLAECALIAGLPQAPSVYSPFNDLQKATERRKQVLNRMLKMKYITKDEFDKACDEPVNLNKIYKEGALNRAPYFADYVINELLSLGFEEDEISQGGYTIKTTLDYNAQKAAQEAIMKDMPAWGLKADKNQAAIFAFSPIDGRIIAYAGGKDYSKSQYDRVTQAVRPPGSSFKPFVYSAALYKGWEPNDLISDMPVEIGDWAPKNYGNKYRGYIPLHKALALSSNVAAVRLIEDTGINPVQVMARELGISTPLSYDYTISLGSNGVKLYDMVVAYGAFANGGFRVRPYSVEEVRNEKGKVVYKAPETLKTKAINYDIASNMNAMMKTVITSGTGVAANLGVEQGGKTGTTDNYNDAWFIGFTPNVVAGVWVGNDDNTALPGLTGGTLPAILWKDMMKEVVKGHEKDTFSYPEVVLENTKPIKPEDVTENVVTDESSAVIIEDEKDNDNKEPVNNVSDTNNYVLKEDKDVTIPLPILNKQKTQNTSVNNKNKETEEKSQNKIEKPKAPTFSDVFGTTR